MLTGIAPNITVALSGDSGAPEAQALEMKASYASYASLPAGSEVDIDSEEIINAVGKLKRVIVSAAVPLKVTVKSVVSGVPTTWGVLMMFPGRNNEFIPERAIAIGAGDKFRVTVKNMEDLAASDVYVTFIWEEILPTPQSALKVSYASFASLPPSSEADLDSSPIAGSEGRLKRVIVSAAVPIRVAVKTVLSDISTTHGVIMVFPERSGEFYAEKAITVGNGGTFRVTVKNMEDLTASDVYVTFIWEEI